MSRLILIKHAQPLVDPQTPSDLWNLSDEGIASCDALAKAISAFDIRTLYSSTEPKARQTAERVATNLGIATQVEADLHEHDRKNVPHLASRDFISMVALFFKQPDKLVLGNETARQATDRFNDAIQRLMQNEPGDLAVVTHGTVIALFAQQQANQDPFNLWRKMGLPSFIAFDRTQWNVETLYEKI